MCPCFLFHVLGFFSLLPAFGAPGHWDPLDSPLRLMHFRTVSQNPSLRCAFWEACFYFPNNHSFSRFLILCAPPSGCFCFPSPPMCPFQALSSQLFSCFRCFHLSSTGSRKLARLSSSYPPWASFSLCLLSCSLAPLWR